MKIHHKQSGFAHMAIVLVIIVIAAIGFVGMRVLNNDNELVSDKSSGAKTSTADAKPSGDPKIKHLGFNLDYYDKTTNKAGDFVFTKDTFTAGETLQMLFMNYGNVVPGNSANGGMSKSNPQPTFILPIGTKVHSLVDGVVFDVPKLYSNDYSIQVQADGSDLIFETEHVLSPLVKKGDTVKAGDVIAEVSDYDKHGYAGLGLFEIGILKGGNPPSHVCPFEYLDDSIKEETLKKITAVQASWEEYRGDSSIYDESKIVVPGCETLDPIEG